MPELPEVETIRMGLQKHLVGHKIIDVEVRLKKMVTGDTKHVIGSKVVDIRRFGKGLVIDLDNKYSIAVHIKLTGQLVYRDIKIKSDKDIQKVKVIKGSYAELPNKWTHVIFKLDRGAVLYYNDFRQFGWIKIIESSKLQELSFFKDLGPEFPVVDYSSSERSESRSNSSRQARTILTLELFKQILSKSKIAIKPLLMDQKKIGGIGNIYANDGLNLAKIDPQRKAFSLKDEEVQTLFKSLETVLKRGLKYGGASELSYVNAIGGEGSYQDHFLVYSREGEKCFNCGGIIKKIMLGGRGTYFCPKCQK